MKNGFNLLLGLIITLQINCQNKELKNLFWFDGERFQEKTIYIKDGFFSFLKPIIIHEVINFQGKFILPPYGETHTHNLSKYYGTDKMISQYLKEGILYIQVLGGSHKGRISVKKQIDTSGLAVRYANGGITCKLGHPFTIYEPLAMGIYSAAEISERAKEVRDSRLAENDAYWFFDTIGDVDAKWEKLLATNPDVIKIMLLYSDQFKLLYSNKTRMGGKGVSPEVAQYVVQKAKRNNLRVFAHVETAFDFRTAVNIGVDAIAHIPGYAWNGTDASLSRYLLTEQDLATTAKKDIHLITTTSISTTYAESVIDNDIVFDKLKHDKIVIYQKNLLNQFMEHGIRVSLGSDQYGKTLFAEVDYIHKHNLLSNLQIINSICKTNSQLIFPNRKIGEIKEGYEANFIVLNENPLKEISNLKKVESIYLNGTVLKKE